MTMVEESGVQGGDRKMGCVLGNFILKSTRQEKALHRIYF
ncbi:unnamed protein product [Spirodela intermedia]|uniref:Uncharacterized protein n=1 Tax=Spirodela intermedia TaxID=51605 RepID=A0A7I8K0W1_SPIIN|nr:unnamed protein product [Spirodela intermedia]